MFSLLFKKGRAFSFGSISIAALFILVTLVGAFPGSIALAGDREDLLQFLKRFPELSIPFTNAPGRGHFATTALLMKQIRDSGYKGKFHLYLDERVRSRVATFLPGYLDSGPAEQNIPFWNARTHPLKAHSGIIMEVGNLAALPDFKTLAIVGGEDRHLSPSAMGVDALLVVQPSHWSAASELRVNAERYDGSYYSYAFKDAKTARVRVDYEVPEDPEAWIKAEFAYDPAHRGKAQGIVDLLRNRRNHEIFTVYGLEFQRTEQMLCSALEAIQRLGKSTLVPVLNHLSTEKWKRLVRCLEESGTRVKRVSVFDPTLRKKMRDMKENSILIVNIGPVPQSVFYYLMDESTLPPFAEGNSTIDFLSMRGKAYFSTTARRRSETAEVSRFLDHAHSDLLSGDIEDLVWAMKEAKDPNSSLSKMFRANQEAFFAKPDKLGLLTDQIEETLACNRLLRNPLARFQQALSWFVSEHLWSR